MLLHLLINEFVIDVQTISLLFFDEIEQTFEHTFFKHISRYFSVNYSTQYLEESEFEQIFS